MADALPRLIQDAVAQITLVQRVRSWGKMKVAFTGDSITASNDSFNSPMTWAAENNSSPAFFAMLNSKGAWELIVNAGIGGQTSTQILARFQQDILNNYVDIVVLFSMTMNDIGQNVPLVTSIANVTSMITQSLAAGILPILCTPSPYGQTGATAQIKTAVAERRRLFIELGRQFNIPVVDLFTVTVDPTTGLISNTYNQDGSVHANVAGRKALSQAIGTVLDSICSNTAIPDIGYAGDSDDILNGIGFMLGAPVAGIAGGWSNSGFDAAATASIFNDPTLGNMQRITTTATVGNSFIVCTFNVIKGHTYELNGFLSKNGTSTAQISINGTGNRRLTYNGTDPDITRGRFNVRAVAQNSETMTYYLLAGPGTGTVDYGRLTVRDLTVLGIS